MKIVTVKQPATVGVSMGFGHVMANREDLRKYFPEEVWSRLPEEDHLYAFGIWITDNVGCPVMQALRETRRLHESFDIACHQLVIETRSPAHATFIPVPKPGDPIPVA